MSADLAWDASALYTTGEISVANAVPLSTAAFGAAPLLGALAYRRPRTVWPTPSPPHDPEPRT